MRVAVTVWKDRISPVFDVSRKFLILDIEDSSIKKEALDIFENDNSIYMVSKLLRLNIEILICGAISNPLFKMVTSHGIKAIPYTCGNIDDVIQAFLKNALPDQKLSMPGCCGFRKQAHSQNQQNTSQEVVILPKGAGTGLNGQGQQRGRGKGRCGPKGRQTNISKDRGGGKKQNRQGNKI